MCDEGYVNLACQDSTWVVDLVISFHNTSRYDLFTSYRKEDFGTIRMRNINICKIIDIEDVCLEINVGCILHLRDVRHVSDI
jgi:hypothetical protein